MGLLNDLEGDSYMTLILNEIHLFNGLTNSMIIAAADRRISRSGVYDSTRRKLFKIPHLNGAVSYFGLACVYPDGREEYLSSWLPNFINHQSATNSLKGFAENLQSSLNSIVPPSILKNNPSGFHICGYNSLGYPDFWYFSNIGSLKNFKYGNLHSQYDSPDSHFLGRDAKDNFKWDGVNALSAQNGVQIYRNGDFRAHAFAWEKIDEIYSQLLSFPDFKVPKSAGEYKEYIKFKFEMLAYIYKKRASQEIIARPIDVFIFTNGI